MNHLRIEHPRRRVCCKLRSVPYLLGSHRFSPFEDIDVQRKFLSRWRICLLQLPVGVPKIQRKLVLFERTSRVSCQLAGSNNNCPSSMEVVFWWIHENQIDFTLHPYPYVAPKVLRPQHMMLQKNILRKNSASNWWAISTISAISFDFDPWQGSLVIFDLDLGVNRNALRSATLQLNSFRTAWQSLSNCITSVSLTMVLNKTSAGAVQSYNIPCKSSCGVSIFLDMWWKSSLHLSRVCNSHQTSWREQFSLAPT